MDLTLQSTSATIKPDGGYFFEVTLEDIVESALDTTQVAECVSIEIFIRAHGAGDILDEIGIDIVKEYFDLTETK